MSHDLLHALMPVAGLGVNVLCQVACFRLVPRLGLLKSIVIGFAVGMIGTAAADALVGAGLVAAGLLTNIIIYAALGYCYFHFVNLGETARRIRVLRELHEAEDGLTLTDLLARYGADQIVSARLARLLASGQIVLRDGRYFIGRRTVLLMARSIVALKGLVLGRRSEFD